MYGLIERIQRAGADISEALSVGAPPVSGAPSTPVGPTPPPPPAPPPQGALGAGRPPPQPMPQGRNPLTVMTDFKSPPLAAVLQGPRGQESQMRPIGFARGGLAVFKDR